jgi:hypothetical protein
MLQRYVSLLVLVPLLALLSACGAGGGAATADADPGAPELDDDATPRVDRVRALLETLAADSMMGRRAGTEGERMAVRVLESELARYRVQPVGTDGYRQPVPLLQSESARGGLRWGVMPADVDLDTVPAERVRIAYNVLGVIPGSGELAREIVIVGAHHDHVGIGVPVDGDSIYNGADDDASGSVAVLEAARALVRRGAGDGPRRTIVAAFFTAEEMGLIGTRHWIDNPTVDFGAIVADLQVEMIARPDSLSGGFGKGWLTGYERSTMGDILAAQGSPIVPDPRPEQRFFFRSDNLPFAERGIPAHTLSSFNMHTDYHQPSDEAERADFAHMTALIEAAIEMLEELATGPTPAWKEGGRPDFPD